MSADTTTHGDRRQAGDTPGSHDRDRRAIRTARDPAARGSPSLPRLLELGLMRLRSLTGLRRYRPEKAYMRGPRVGGWSDVATGLRRPGMTARADHRGTHRRGAGRIGQAAQPAA
jgi:hypothetical protein